MAFKSQLELFVERYVKNISHFGNIRSKKKIILKALYMIDAELGIPCCNDPFATVSYTREDDILTNFLRNYFAENFDRRKNKNSLTRIKSMLINALGRYATDYAFLGFDDNGEIPSCCFIKFTFNLFESYEVFEGAKLRFSLVDTDNGNIVAGPHLFTTVPGEFFSIPKGNYRLVVQRLLANSGGFNTMTAHIFTDSINLFKGGLSYPSNFGNTVGEYTSDVISLQEDSHINYFCAFIIDPT